MRTPWGECAVWDAHIHFFSRHFFDTLALQADKPIDAVAMILGWDLPAADPVELGARWTAELDKHGVERAACIASIPGDEASVAGAAAVWPDRLLPYAMVNPMAERPPALAGLRAICLFPAMHRYFMHDPQVEALLKQAAPKRPLIFVHCGLLTVAFRKKLGLPSPFDMRYSNPIDLHAVALKHPRLNFVIPHFGAGYFREALMVAELCPNVYLDTSSSNRWMQIEGLDLKTVFRRSLDTLGPNRLLFGTDSSYFPRGWNAEIFTHQVEALREIGVNAASARAILGENLKRLTT